MTAAVLVVGVTGSAAASSTATQTGRPLDRAAIAQRILDSPGGRFLTSPARLALSAAARGSGAGVDTGLPAGEHPQALPRSSVAEVAAPPARLVNVRVNNPSEDVHNVDQTTQSETTVAVDGRRVVVGFNDSQQSLLTLTAGSNLTGYAYSADGGTSFTDGGALPNAAGQVNVGDPWTATDRTGHFYYSTLTVNDLGVGVSVAVSNDGGARWQPPVQASLPGGGKLGFYAADKPAITVGSLPGRPLTDVLYDTWDDTAATTDGATSSGIPVARSLDGGRSWQIS